MHWRKWSILEIAKEDFPEQLKQIKNCPEKLYFRGKWDEEIFKNCLAVVGSRRMSRYGEEIVKMFLPELVRNKITIVSGFMYGVDSEAHRFCVANGGKTIAVLGSGLNYLTTADNDNLYTQILESGGLVISQFESDFKATVWSFPQRNLVVAGLSNLGVLVVEAGMKSGSLITARIAREQGKKVFALPGPITSKISEGTNWLIKENLAKLVNNSADILDIESPTQMNLIEGLQNPLESKIFKLLKIEPLSIDELCRKLNLNINELTTQITMMSLNNLVAEENGRIYLVR